MNATTNTKKQRLRNLPAILLTLLLASKTAYAVSIGTAPGILDLGIVRPGEDREFEFYLITNAPYDMLVTLNAMHPHKNFYNTTASGLRYTFIAAESTYTDQTAWLEIKRNPVIVSPSNTQVIELADGSVARINTVVNAILHVPLNADPCYHAGSISLYPETPPGQPGMGVTTLGLTRFMYVFKVAGDAVRNGEIVDIEGIRESDNRVRFDVLFKNTGTCTLDAFIDGIKVFGKYGNTTVSLKSSDYMIKPGDIGILTTYWMEDKTILAGNYKVEATVDYTTDKRLQQKDVSISAIPVARIIREGKTTCGFPWWTIILIIVLGLMAHRMKMISQQTLIRLGVVCIVIAFYGMYACLAAVPWTWILISVIIILLAILLRG